MPNTTNNDRFPQHPPTIPPKGLVDIYSSRFRTEVFQVGHIILFKGRFLGRFLGESFLFFFLNFMFLCFSLGRNGGENWGKSGL